MQVRRFKVTQGLELTGDVGGDEGAQPVILLHGGGQTRHSWAGAMRELVAQGYYVVNLDSRGHGESDWSPDGEYTLASLAADLDAVIDQLPRLPALVGASMGGATSLYLLGNARRPRAAALVLVDIVPNLAPEGAAKIAAFMRANPDGFASVEQAAAAVAAYNPHRPRPSDTSGLMKNLRERDGRFYWHWDPKFLRAAGTEPPVLADALKAACAGISVPTLLVRGLRSDLVTQKGVQQFRALLPRAEVFDVPGAGHMVAGDRNDAFNRGVLDFLNRHCPPRP